MPSETLEGVIERITFYSEESGYTVLRLRPNTPMHGQVGRDGLATVVGTLPELQTGEAVRFTGVWQVHSEYGKQFRAELVQQLTPTTLEGLKKYLGSGAIRGIGSVTAQRIIDHFGMKALDILDNNPSRIEEVPGIGSYRAELIAKAWAEQYKVKEVMIFLQGHGISASHAVKIHKEYGDNAVQMVKADPYRLARDISGIGFKTADAIARKLGLALDAPKRIEAGVIYALETLTSDGHVYAPRPIVVKKVAELLELRDAPEDIDEYQDEDTAMQQSPLARQIDAAITRIGREEQIALQQVPDEDDEDKMVEGIYLRPMYASEKGSARRLLDMTTLKTTRLRSVKTMSWIKFFSLLSRERRVELTEQQKSAVEAALTNKISVLTGGPGTGKTTTLRAVIRALEFAKAKYALASPTGRASKRLSEATERPASTIHRLLGFAPGEGYVYNEAEPLDVDMLIIDEASMIDQVLFYSVLKALSPDTHLMLVGDVDQLPSVGAGDILRDLIKSGIAHVTRLDAIFRQSGDSQIIANAHRINHGEMPMLDNRADDFFMFAAEDPQSVGDLVVDVVQNRIPSKFGLDPLNDIQVLAPMYRGAAGIQVLNERLQMSLNPPGPNAERKMGGTIFRVGDKVMQTRNNYDKDVYNGDIGRIVGIDYADQQLKVIFDDRIVDYEWSEVDELVHAFAVSVHKSQGSEYPAVVLPVVTQHYMMLQRNLLYTAVTRAKQLVVFVGQKRAIGIAVKNDKVTQRYTALAWRLASSKKK